MIVGRYKPGSTPLPVAADQVIVSGYTFIGNVRLPKLTVYVDGLGPGFGTQQVLRAVVYYNGALVGRGDEVTVLDGQLPGWVDLPFLSTPGGVYLAVAGRYDIGLHAGPAGNIVRVYS